VCFKFEKRIHFHCYIWGLNKLVKKNMKLVKLGLGIAIVSILLAFNTQSIEQTDVIGVYGSKDMFTFTLNSDNSFRYFNSASKSKKHVEGRWEMIDGNVILIPNDNSKILTKWTLVNDNGCLRSKKGMTTYTLCRRCD
jgi:hypothetical protein